MILGLLWHGSSSGAPETQSVSEATAGTEQTQPCHCSGATPALEAPKCLWHVGDKANVVQSATAHHGGKRHREG